MITLLSTNKLIIKCKEVKTTTESVVDVAWYTNKNAESDITENAVVLSTNGTTNVDIVSAPAAGYNINVTDFLIYNADTIPHTYYIIKDTSATERIIFSISLLPNATATYSNGVISYVGNQIEIPLSGSTNGKGIKVTQTATKGDTIHVPPAGTCFIDVIELYITNNDTVSRVITIEWGTVTAADGNIFLTIPSKTSLTYTISEIIIQNSLEITAFCASAANVLIVFGKVIRKIS